MQWVAYSHLATGGGFKSRLPELHTSLSLLQNTLQAMPHKNSPKDSRWPQQGWSYHVNAKLLNPTLITTALNMKPETVCKSLCVLHSIVSHLSKYCRYKRRHVEEKQTQLSRAPITFPKRHASGAVLPNWGCRWEGP